MQQNNMPPFVVGQKVVCIKTKSNGSGHTCTNGTVYTVKGMVQCTCGAWKVDIGVADSNCKWTHMKCDRCGDLYFRNFPIIWANADLFAPIHSDFKSISLTKVLETETPLVGEN